MSTTKIWHWGIVGTGRIASDFVGALKSVPNAKVVAIGGREEERAKEFAEKHGIARAYGTYEQVAQDDEVEIVYVATLHPMHAEVSIGAMERGKAVLVEKPMAMNAKEASAMIQTARKCGVYLQEAMWTRYFPVTKEVRRLVKEGAIGRVISVEAKLGFCANQSLSRLSQKSHGASALLDVGIYPISYASMILGSADSSQTGGGTPSSSLPLPPSSIISLASLSSHPDPSLRFDTHFSASLQYSSAIATVEGSFDAPLDSTALITGSLGRISIPNFWCPTSFSLLSYSSSLDASSADSSSPNSSSSLQLFDPSSHPHFALPYPPPGSPPHSFHFTNSQGLAYEAIYLQNALERGLLESELQSLDESLFILQTIDTIALQIGFHNSTNFNSSP